MALSLRNRAALWSSRRFWYPAYARVKQAAGAIRDSAALRPSQREHPAIGSYTPDTAVVQWPQYSSWYHQWYLLADYSIVARVALQALGVRMTRNGFEWKPKYAAKCMSCAAELAELPPALFDEDVDREVDPATGDVTEKEVAGDILRECPECGSVDLIEPDWGAVPKAEEFLDRVNANRRSWRKVVRQTKRDLDIADELYIIRRKAYFLDDNGRIQFDDDGFPRFELLEWIPGDPRLLRIIADDRGNLGGLWWVCIRCRVDGKHHAFPSNRNQRVSGNHRRPVNDDCPQCGGVLYDAHYVSLQAKATRAVSYGTSGPYDTYYIAGEVLHTSQYTPTTLYSSAPPMAAAFLALSMIENILGYLHDFYAKRRNPRKFIWARGVNKDWTDKLSKKHKEIADKDADEVAVLGVKKDGEVGILDLDTTPREMLLDKQLQDWATRAGMIWQVTPVFTSEAKSSGLSQDGIKVTVTEDAIDDGQSIFNEDVHPPLVVEDLTRVAPGIDAFELSLVPNREEDAAKDQELRLARVTEAEKMRNMGWTPKLERQDDVLIFKYEGEATKAPDLSLDGIDDLFPGKLEGAEDNVQRDNPAEDGGPGDVSA